jgi:hypothetical protein
LRLTGWTKSVKDIFGNVFRAIGEKVGGVEVDEVTAEEVSSFIGLFTVIVSSCQPWDVISSVVSSLECAEEARIGKNGLFG